MIPGRCGQTMTRHERKIGAQDISFWESDLDIFADDLG